MARYIDADALYEKLYPLDLVDKRLYTINAKAVADAIANTPTADVVPKSEVDKIENAYNRAIRKVNKNAITAIQKAKQEVAREIFEEIEELLKRTCEKGYCGSISDLFAELKKKYTEENDG